MFFDESHDCLDQLLNVAEGTASQPLVCDLTEPSLDEIQPRTARGNKVHVKAGMTLQPRFYARMFVRGVIF